MAAPEIFEPLTSIQLAALDLYRRGLNVLPLPRPYEVRAWAAREPENRDALSKPPFILRPFFTSRLHLCSFECERHGCKLPPSMRFTALFETSNVGVMTGRTSGNLIAIDCDSPAAFSQIGKELTRRALSAWCYTTHRGGVYLMRVIERECENIPAHKALFPDVEVWANRHYVVLPPSLHPLGTVYQWVSKEPREMHPGETPPLVSVEALDWLGVHLVRKDWHEPDLLGLPAFTVHLSLSNRRILATASTLKEGERNQQLSKPAYDLAAAIRAGTIDYIDGERLLLSAASDCNYPEKDALSMLKSALHKRGLKPASKRTTAPRAHQLAERFAGSYDWRVYHRKAQGARAAFMACIERSRLEGEPFRASVREVAELANFAQKERAGRALNLLTSDTQAPALLHRETEKDDCGAHRFRFTALVKGARESALSNTTTTTCFCSGVTESAPKTIAERDLFVSLGAVSERTYKHLLEHPERTAAAIARETKQCDSSVRRALKALMAHGLVILSKAESLYIGEPKTLHEIETLAAALGSLGVSDKRKRTHRLERERMVNKATFKARLYWRQFTITESEVQ